MRGSSSFWIRVLVVSAAVVIGLWFANGIRQARDVDQATAIISSSSTPTRAQAQRAASLLSSASTLYPGTDVELLQGELAENRGQNRLAETIFTRVTRQEPDNFQGWLQLANETSNQNIAVPALAHVGHLIPKVPGPQ
jgi:hypothetical protein